VITLAKNKAKTRNLNRLRKPLPFTVDGKLRNISLGISLGEAYVGCSGGRLYLRVSMCDKKAVEMVAKAWGSSVGMHRYKIPRCKPTPENPEGHEYSTTVIGKRADLVIKGYEPEVIGTELYNKWKRLKKRCKQ